MLAVLVTLSSCNKPASIAPATEDPIPVMGTTYGLADIIRQVGGDQVRIAWVTEAGRQLGPDGIPGPAVINDLNSRKLVLVNGLNEPWATSGFDDPIMGQRIIRLDLRLPESIAAAGGAVWLDPSIAIFAAEETARRLSAVRPGRQSDFNANAARFTSAVRAAWARHPELNLPPGVSRRPLVVTIAPHYAALLLRGGIDEQRIENAIPSALSESDLKRIRKAVADGATAIVVDIDTPDMLRQDITRRTSLPVIAIDAQGTSSGTTGRDTYLGLLDYDLKQLLEIHRLQSKRRIP